MSSSHKFSISNDFGSFSADCLNEELKKSSISGKFVHIATSGDDCDLFFTDDLSQQDQDALLQIVQDHPSLDTLKRHSCSGIDDKTQEVLDRGFEYPNGSGKRFPLDTDSKTLLLGVIVSKDFLTYPLRWNTADQESYYDIQSANDVIQFYGTAVGTVKYHQDFGTSLKDKIRAATTKAQIDAVVDPR